MLLRDKLGDEQEDVSVASLPWDKITCSVAWFYFHCDTKLECNPYAILVSSGAEFFSTSCKSSSDVSDLGKLWHPCGNLVVVQPEKARGGRDHGESKILYGSNSLSQQYFRNNFYGVSFVSLFLKGDPWGQALDKRWVPVNWHQQKFWRNESELIITSFGTLANPEIWKETMRRTSDRATEMSTRQHEHEHEHASQMLLSFGVVMKAFLCIHLHITLHIHVSYSCVMFCSSSC